MSIENKVPPVPTNEEKSTVEQGVKHDNGKPRYSLIPNGTLDEVVDVLEFGATKYSNNGWQQANNAKERYYNASMRHIQAWWNGERHDKETGKHHLAHAICCLMFLMWFDKASEQAIDTLTRMTKKFVDWANEK